MATTIKPGTESEEDGMAGITWTAAPSSAVAKLRRDLARARAALEAVNSALNEIDDAGQYLPEGQRLAFQAQATYVEDLATTVKRKI